MNADIFQKIERIFQKQQSLSNIDFESVGQAIGQGSDLQKIIADETREEPVGSKNRIQDELFGFGPLAPLIADSSITEILVNAFDQVFFERAGILLKNEDHFFSDASYTAFIDRLSQKCQTYMNRDKPFIEAQFENMRVTLIFSEIARGACLISIRKQPLQVWTLEKFHELGWCSEIQLSQIRSVLERKKNFLVVGATGSGKTSFLQALLQALSQRERAVIVEDTQEIRPPNSASVSLLTRQDPSRTVSDVTMDDLLKRALRLRPDRLVLGEIRGPEAKTLLMMMATGHDGSFGSLHARNAPEALLRLEMLVQMGAPQWTLTSIRKLMAMTIQTIFVVEKVNGKRRLGGIFEITSLEESGLTLQAMDEI